MLRSIRPLAVALATTLALAGCSSLQGRATLDGELTADARPVSDGGTLQVALASDPDRLDPTRSSTLVARQVFSSMCEKLFDLDEGMNIVPQLAAGPAETSADGKTLTIRLRDGVRFADGTPMDSAAVLKSLDRHLNFKGSSRKSELAAVASMAAPDARTVVLTLKQPDAALMSVLADRAGMVMAPASIDALGENFANKPVCVGAFKFVERVPGDRIVLEKDPNYYDASKVHLDRVVYRIITDASVRLANMRSKDVQLGDQMSPIDVGSMATDSGLVVFHSGSLGYQGLYFNIQNTNGLGKPPMPVDNPFAKDKRLRQALSLSIDRQLLTTIVFQGTHQPACTPIAPGLPLASALDATCPGRDVEKAKQLIAEAGYTAPVPLELTLTNTPEASRLGQVIQAMAADAGIEVKLRPMEFAAAIATGDSGQFQALQAGWSGRLDPDGNISRFVKSTGSNNYATYANPEVDKLLKQATTTTDLVTRRGLYEQLNKVLSDDAPVLYLYRQSNLVAMSTKVSGVRVYRDGLIRITEAGYTK